MSILGQSRIDSQAIGTRDRANVPRYGDFRQVFHVAMLTWLTTCSIAIGDETPKVEAPPAGEKKSTAAVEVATTATHESTASAVAVHPVVKAKRMIADCQAKYGVLKDYTCVFIKRERIQGVMSSQHEMMMKARTTPLSFYMKFRRPHKGREAIYIDGKNDGKVKAHDVGIGKLIAGTMNLDPKGSMAMENSLHPITEAGIGALIETVAYHWNAELKEGESEVRFQDKLKIGKNLCTMIETTHPKKGPNYRFYRVRLYVDLEHGLPIRFEAYDWPKHPGAEPELVEEYTYLDLKTNQGLTDLDFDASNKAYSFGRF